MDRVPTFSRTTIDERWLDTVPEHDQLGMLVDSSRAWDREPVALPVRVTAALWCIAGANVLVGCWAAGVFTQFWSCSGVLGWLTTLGNRPGLLLTLSAICVLTTTGTALLTGGLTRANGWQLGVLVLAAVVGIACLLGPVAILAVASAVVAAALFVVERL